MKADEYIRHLFETEPASLLYVAINRVLVKNDPNLMQMMRQASSRMCLATALTPGFRGFDLMRQRGACPMGLRWAAKPDMSQELSHVWIDQFTYWDSWQAHEKFHETFEDVVVDSCNRCGAVMLEGPEEPIFRIVHSDLPKLVSLDQWLKKNAEGKAEAYAVDSGKTVTVLAEHIVRPGKEAEFEAAEITVLNKLKESGGMLGFQILKRIGLSCLGSAHPTVESMMEDMQDPSGSKLKPAAAVWEGYTIPAQYLVMVEWESLHAAENGMPHVHVKPDLLFIHGPKVLNNCIRMPSVRIAESMFREQTNRDILNKLKL